MTVTTTSPAAPRSAAALLPAPRPAADAAVDLLEVLPSPRPVGAGVVFLNWRDLTNPEGGGSELYVETVAQRLAATGEAVTVFCAAHANAPRDEVKDGVRYLRRGNHLTVYLWAALLGLFGGFGEHGLVVEVHNGVPFLARQWSRRPVVELVHHVHREQWPVVFGPVGARVGWWLESWLAPRVNRRCSYVAVSDVTRDELAGLGVDPARVTVVHNGTTPPLPTTAARTAHPSVVVLGRVVPHKRVELVLQAAAALRDALPGLRVDVVGDGYWLPALRDEVARLGLADVVTLHGRVDEQTKADLLARSWVHAVPSVKEGWGLSVVEAGTHSTPSIAFRAAGGLAESIVDGTSGVLVDDEQGLQDGLRTLLTDTVERERLALGARRHAARFTWAGTATAFGAVLEAARP
ncbi:MAG: glycosyl transferase group 1 [Frankiales bacterium]|nr:glycosyl transferase group 1 [Frankiales bacterium]